MAAPEGNQFWKARSKHGRDKIFETPEILWDAACEYFEWCENNPVKIDLTDKRMRPFTLQGLCLFLHVNTAYFRQFKSNLSEGEQGFSTIIKEIEEIIYNQKFTGAAVGYFKENLISRDLGLTDKTDLTTGGEKIVAKSVITLPNGTTIDLG